MRLSATSPEDDRLSFGCRLEVSLEAPVGDDEVADLFVVVQGDFVSEFPIDDALYQRYMNFTPVALLWPYARAYVAQLSAMLGVQIPPLPSLDVIGGMSAARPQEG